MAETTPVPWIAAEIEIYVATEASLDLADVGRFFQRLDTVARRASRRGDVQIEIVDLEIGSLRAKIGFAVAVGSMMVDGSGLALDVANRLKSEPAAAKATYALIKDSPGAKIYISSGDEARQPEPITADDLIAQDGTQATLPRPRDVELLTGPQVGFVRKFSGI